MTRILGNLVDKLTLSTIEARGLVGRENGRVTFFLDDKTGKKAESGGSGCVEAEVKKDVRRRSRSLAVPRRRLDDYNAAHILLEMTTVVEVVEQ